MSLIVIFIAITISIIVINRANSKYLNAINIEIQKNKEQEEYDKQLKQKIQDSEETLKQIALKEQSQYANIEQLQKIINEMVNTHHKVKEEKETLIQQYDKDLSLVYKSLEESFNQRVDSLLFDFDEFQEQIEQKKKNVEEELNKIKSSLSAGRAARLREEEKKDKLAFYKLKVLSSDLDDIQYLNRIKSNLRQPVILSKLIWTTYFQKATNDLCSRIVGSEKTCGIYKITNIVTEQCYIGQSINIAERFKQHIKCGLGIDTPSTNKLYASMQEYGVWSFTFEILEKCSKEDLDAKEKFWIEMYQANAYGGYNSTKGNK